MFKKLFTKNNLRKVIPIIILIVLSIPAVKALFVPGFFGASDDLHIGWLYEMDRALSAFKFPARYVPDLSYGFGYPLFNFVFPLPFYLGEVFLLAGLSLVGSVKAVFLTGLVFSGISMFYLLRKFSDDYISILGSMIYLYAPYRSTDVYVRGAIGESLSFIFLPLIILGVIKLSKSKGWNYKWIGILGLSLGGLITTHNIVAYMFAPCLVILLVMTAFNAVKRKAYIFNTIASISLGLLASIFFWLPAIKDSGLMQYSTVFNYVDHFPTIKQLFTPYFGYGASVPGPGDGMSFFLGWAALILIPLSIIIFAVKFRKISVQVKIIFTWALITFFASIFMMNFRSSFFWDNIPLLGYFQFPWRFLTLTSLLIPIFLIVLPDFKLRKYLVSISVIILVAVSMGNFKPHDFLGRQDAYYLDRYIPLNSVSSEYRNLSEEYLRLPKGTVKRPDNIYPRFFSEDSIKVSNLVEINSLDSRAEIFAEKESIISYNKYLFPGWSVLVDGEKFKLEAGYPFGQISFKLNPGSHGVEVYFRETKFNTLLDIASFIAILTSITLIGYYCCRKNENN